MRKSIKAASLFLLIIGIQEHLLQAIYNKTVQELMFGKAGIPEIKALLPLFKQD